MSLSKMQLYLTKHITFVRGSRLLGEEPSKSPRSFSIVLVVVMLSILKIQIAVKEIRLTFSSVPIPNLSSIIATQYFPKSV